MFRPSDDDANSYCVYYYCWNEILPFKSIIKLNVYRVKVDHKTKRI